MSDETNAVLLAILEVLREQTIYLHRQHGWIMAIGDTVALKTDLDAFLKEHPFYRQAPRPDVDITADQIQKIDALIQRLKSQS
jgi:hypothetical protein